MNNGQRTIEQAAPPVVSQWGEPLTPPCVRELRSSPSAKCPPGILLRAHTRRFVKQWDTSATPSNQIKVNTCNVDLLCSTGSVVIHNLFE